MKYTFIALSYTVMAFFSSGFAGRVGTLQPEIKLTSRDTFLIGLFWFLTIPYFTGVLLASAIIADTRK